MCRNIRTLHNFEPPASEDEIGGTTKPSQANEHAYARAVAEVTAATQRLLDSLVTSAPPKDREREAARARVRAAQRFGSAVA